MLDDSIIDLKKRISLYSQVLVFVDTNISNVERVLKRKDISINDINNLSKVLNTLTIIKRTLLSYIKQLKLKLMSIDNNIELTIDDLLQITL